MDDISKVYDIDKLKVRIKEVRKLRWNQYKDNMNSKEQNEFKKYACCKSQESLAEKIGVRRQAIIDWENGNTFPSINNIIELCSAFDCSIDYLLGSGDLPEIDPISKASFYSKISPIIIRYGREHNDYLDCLNYFMLPENCSSLFNEITLTAWKKYWISSSLKEIKPPLKEDIIKIYNEYNAVTPFNEINKKTYKSFLESKLPQNKLILSTKKNETGIKIKGCLNPIIYQNFFSGIEFDYTSFIDYLVENTFEPLSYNSMIELKKTKLASTFVNLFINYLEDMDR